MGQAAAVAWRRCGWWSAEADHGGPLSKQSLSCNGQTDLREWSVLDNCAPFVRNYGYTNLNEPRAHK